MIIALGRRFRHEERERLHRDRGLENRDEGDVAGRRGGQGCGPCRCDRSVSGTENGVHMGRVKTVAVGAFADEHGRDCLSFGGAAVIVY